MDKNAVADGLEWAISYVAKEEFAILTNGLAPPQQEKRVLEAKCSLAGLRALRTPNYEDALVALFYTIEYQPAHVNMAYSIVKHIESRREPRRLLLGDTGRLHVIDFGSGALAAQFGVTLALADALEQRQEISGVRVDSIDASEAMLAIGRKIWNAFVEYVRYHLPNEALSAACEMVRNNFEVHRDYKNIGVMPNSETWLTAFHTIYRTNESEVKDAMHKLCQKFNPIAGAMTCYYKQDSPTLGNLELARRVLPFPKENVEQVNGNGVRPQLPTDRQSEEIVQMCREWGAFPKNYYRIFWGWKNENTAFLTYAPNILPTQPPVPAASQQPTTATPSGNRPTTARTPRTRPTRSTARETPEPIPLSVGDRVQVAGMGSGRIQKIRKGKVDVILDNGWPCEATVSDLRRLPTVTSDRSGRR